jgi:hypothetical protein
MLINYYYFFFYKTLNMYFVAIIVTKILQFYKNYFTYLVK